VAEAAAEEEDKVAEVARMNGETGKTGGDRYRMFRRRKDRGRERSGRRGKPRKEV